MAKDTVASSSLSQMEKGDQYWIDNFDNNYKGMIMKAGIRRYGEQSLTILHVNIIFRYQCPQILPIDVKIIFRYQATYTRGARQGGWQKIDPVPPNLDLLRSRTQWSLPTIGSHFISFPGQWGGYMWNSTMLGKLEHNPIQVGNFKRTLNEF